MVRVGIDLNEPNTQQVTRHVNLARGFDLLDQRISIILLVLPVLQPDMQSPRQSSLQSSLSTWKHSLPSVHWPLTRWSCCSASLRASGWHRLEYYSICPVWWSRCLKENDQCSCENKSELLLYIESASAALLRKASSVESSKTTSRSTVPISTARSLPFKETLDESRYAREEWIKACSPQMKDGQCCKGFDLLGWMVKQRSQCRHGIDSQGLFNIGNKTEMNGIQNQYLEEIDDELDFRSERADFDFVQFNHEFLQQCLNQTKFNQVPCSWTEKRTYWRSLRWSSFYQWMLHYTWRPLCERFVELTLLCRRIAQLNVEGHCKPASLDDRPHDLGRWMVRGREKRWRWTCRITCNHVVTFGSFETAELIAIFE